MDIGRDTPGTKLSPEALQTICCRYYTAAQFVSGKKVLEVGCGAGLGLGYLSKSTKKVIGGDISEDALRVARGHYNGRIELLRLDAHKLPFRDACFDVVVAMEVLYYLSRPEKFLDECHRILVNEGTLVLCIGNKDYPVPLSPNYNLSAPELSALLNHHFNAELFGAFPRVGSPASIKFQAIIYSTAGKALSVIPGGKGVKNYLSNLTNGRNLLLQEELEDKDMMVENFQLTPIPDDSPDFRHRYLYAIAYVRNSKLK